MHDIRDDRQTRHSSWFHRAQIVIEAILAQGERCHDRKSREVLGAQKRPPGLCGGWGSLGDVTQKSELCLLAHGERMTFQVEETATEPCESGWGTEGRHQALCRVPVLSW